MLQVWESGSGVCLHTLGPGSDDGTPGHTKKISAMTVNELQPCKHITCCIFTQDSIMQYWNSVLASLEVVLRSK
jgi:hypothetical protein